MFWRTSIALIVAALLYSASFGGQAASPAAPKDLFKTDPEGFTRARFPPGDWPDREFTICRLWYTSVRSERDGSGWKTDYPYSEINLLIRLGEMSTTSISYDPSQKRPNTWVVKLTDSKLYDCPFLLASDVGTIGIKDEEVITSAGVPPERWVFLGGRLLGQRGVEPVGAGDREGAAARGVSNRGHFGRGRRSCGRCSTWRRCPRSQT